MLQPALHDLLRDDQEQQRRQEGVPSRRGNQRRRLEHFHQVLDPGVRLALLEAIEALAEREVANDVKRNEVIPINHVLRAFALATHGVQAPDEEGNVLLQERRLFLQRLVREGVGQEAPVARVGGVILDGQDAVHAAMRHRVRGRVLLEGRSRAMPGVDVLQRRRRAKRELVRPRADNRPVLVVESFERVPNIPPQEINDRCDLGGAIDFRPRKLRQRVPEDVVENGGDGPTHNLLPRLVGYGHSRIVRHTYQSSHETTHEKVHDVPIPNRLMRTGGWGWLIERYTHMAEVLCWICDIPFLSTYHVCDDNPTLQH
jgi:hypothetical protein